MKTSTTVLLALMVVFSCLAAQAQETSPLASEAMFIEPEGNWIAPHASVQCAANTGAALSTDSLLLGWGAGWCYSDCSRCDTSQRCYDGSPCTSIPLCFVAK